MSKKIFSALLLTAFALHTGSVYSDATSSVDVGSSHATSLSSRFFSNRNASVDNLTVKGDLKVKGDAKVNGELTVDETVTANAFITPLGPILPTRQAFGKLSASPEITNLTISNPQSSVPASVGWQPFPVDTFSTSSNTTAEDPSNATITVLNPGTYTVNATMALKVPPTGGPVDATDYCIGVIVNDVLQLDTVGGFFISLNPTPSEHPGIILTANISGLFTLAANSTIQFVVTGSTGSSSPMIVVSANATVVQVGG